MKYQKIIIDLLDKSVVGSHLVMKINGETFHFGDISKEINVFMNINNSQSLFRNLITDGNLGLAESYMAGDFNLEKGEIYDLLIIFLESRLEEKVRSNPSQVLAILWIRIMNLFQGRYKNVQSHYDIGDELFETFLDPHMTYSCGYKNNPLDSLEQLQINKFDRICQKLRLKEGDTLLDIGCGYGGMLIHAVQNYGVIGTGITISKHHCKLAQERVEKLGLGDKLKIEFLSHKKISGKYDKIVSIGMMEHLVRSDYKTYTKNISSSLKDNGLGLIHTIGCNSPKNHHDPFIQKYVFPGSGQPKLSEISYHLEKERLAILDVENIVRHYAHTGLEWFNRFNENKVLLDEKKYDQRFRRMWEYYLSCVVAGGTASDSAVYHVLFSKSARTDFPLHRV
jgi:cyclopropane-fatty-acyl-phospholipid synthase